MKIAVIHDWLVTYAGAERVLTQILQCFPEADLFAVVDFFDDETRRQYLLGKKATTTFIQKLPGARTRYRTYLPLMPLAIEQLDLSAYDLVISCSHAVAKGIITGPDQLHISYVHSPMRYAWDLQHQYLMEAGLAHGVRSWLARYFLHKMRLWDLRTANGVDHFIANSQFIARRIWKVYRRSAEVIYPPVDTEYFTLPTANNDSSGNSNERAGKPHEDYYLSVGRLVPYKKVDLIVKAFKQLPQKKLIVIGDGPQMEQIKQHQASNVTLLGAQTTAQIRDYMQHARALIFAAEEDFGIVPVEAQACGTPVIAYAKGGCLETVIGGLEQREHLNATGVFFAEQNEAALLQAIEKFESLKFAPDACRSNALRFAAENFRKRFVDFVNEQIAKRDQLV
jgi:glycosyltransferase involved in cell wall biosynthesis